MRYDAFFISPKGEIIPVPIRHVLAITKNPEQFGLTQEEIEAAYEKYHEEVGWEGNARNEIILGLLKKDWIRLRYQSRGETWRLQIFEQLNETLKQNALKFVKEVKKGNIINQLHRATNPFIEIHNTLGKTLVNESLTDTIKFLIDKKIDS